MYDELSKFGNVLLDTSFKEKTSFKIGGKIKYYIEVTDFNNLKSLIKYLLANKIPYFVIGNGTNLLASDDDFDIVVISLKCLNNYYQEDETFIIEAGALATYIGTKVTMLGYKSPLCLSLIPGSIGGVIYMNAGAYGVDVKQYLTKVEYLDETGEVKYLENFNDFSYRNTPFKNNNWIITKGYFRFEKDKTNSSLTKLNDIRNIKRLTQPLNTKCAGSVFKNGKDFTAWKEIKKLNLDKLQIGDARVSMVHANVFVNDGDATFRDMYELINKVKQIVYDKSKIILEEEIEIIKPQDIVPYQ